MNPSTPIARRRSPSRGSSVLLRLLVVCSSLVTALAMHPARARTRIAVLGLEGNGVSTEIVQRVSRAIIQPVARAPGYRLVPGMALDEVKLVFGCVRERPDCMAGVGTNLQVANLLWGSVRGSANRFTVTLKLLTVSAKRVTGLKRAEFTGLDALNPGAGASRLVRALLGGEVGSLQVLSSIDTADVLVDGQLVGRTTNGRLLIPELAPGPHALAVHASGHTWRKRVAITAGSTTDIEADMSQAGAVPASELRSAEGSSSSTGWHIAFWTTAAAALGTGIALIPNGLKVHSLATDKESELERLTGPDSNLNDAQKADVARQGCDAPAYPGTGDLQRICNDGKTHAVWQNILIGVTAGLTALSAVFAYKAFAGKNTDKEKPNDHPADLAWWVVPSIGPHGGQVGLHLQF